MKRLHFEAFAPVCPACRAPGAAAPVRVAAIERADAADGDWVDLLEGMLECTNPDCLREYPVLDGVPMLVADMSGLLRSSPLHFAFREDIGPRVLSALVDGAGPDSELERLLRFLSHYAPDHYGDLDPEPCPGTPTTAPITQLVAAAVEAVGPLGALPAGPAGPPLVADLGCGVGRGSFALAAATGGLVVGVDLNLAMLQLASRALRRGRARYPVRRVGMVYSWREHPVDLPGAARVDFWMADAHALPFADASLGLVTSLNLIDCLGDPAAHLRELDRITAHEGKLALCTPYDWSPNATAAPGWIGGHSQRAVDGGASEPRARALFGGPLLPRLALQAEVHALPWQLRVHDRSTMHYQTHLLVGQAG